MRVLSVSIFESSLSQVKRSRLVAQASVFKTLSKCMMNKWVTLRGSCLIPRDLYQSGAQMLGTGQLHKHKRHRISFINKLAFLFPVFRVPTDASVRIHSSFFPPHPEATIFACRFPCKWSRDGNGVSRRCRIQSMYCSSLFLQRTCDTTRNGFTFAMNCKAAGDKTPPIETNHSSNNIVNFEWLLNTRVQLDKLQFRLKQFLINSYLAGFIIARATLESTNCALQSHVIRLSMSLNRNGRKNCLQYCQIFFKFGQWATRRAELMVIHRCLMVETRRHHSREIEATSYLA